MAIEIKDLPIEHGDFPQFCECLPEGNHQIWSKIDSMQNTWLVNDVFSRERHNASICKHGVKWQPNQHNVF